MGNLPDFPASGSGILFYLTSRKLPGSGVLTFLLPVSYHFRKRGRHHGVFQNNITLFAAF
jgi:hypothetical protein